jgi:hypothetical protein
MAFAKPDGVLELTQEVDQERKGVDVFHRVARWPAQQVRHNDAKVRRQVW